MKEGAVEGLTAAFLLVGLIFMYGQNPENTIGYLTIFLTTPIIWWLLSREAQRDARRQ